MNKIKAYTIIELIVVMILTAIVVSITYSVWRIITQQFAGYRSNNEQVKEFLLLERLLAKDFKNCNKIFGNEKELNFHYCNRMVSYSFGDIDIVRKEREVVDTFHLKSSDIMINPIGLLPYVGNLKFSVQKETGPVQLFFNKQYSSDIIINSD